jgi:hypothetical protein
MTVKQQQHLLAYLGYYVGNVDGIWGTLSKTACKAFQMDFFQMDSKVDGICGAETEKALTHAVAYGMPAKQVETKEEVAISKTETTTGTFWDGIKYFKKSEFACKCGCGLSEMNETLIRVADRTREHFGGPMIVSSGRRCASHNARVGGVANSRHITDPGKAMDFCVKGKSSSTVLAYVQKQPEIRYAYAIDGSYVHMDVL